MAYTFSTVTASNGVKLYSIKTSPKNITVKSIGASSVVGQTAYGVNGGYFYDGTLLQIAVNNNVAVAPNGSENAKQYLADRDRFEADSGRFPYRDQRENRFRNPGGRHFPGRKRLLAV